MRISPISTPPPPTASTTNAKTNGAEKKITNKEDGAKSITEQKTTKDMGKEKKAKKRKSIEATVRLNMLLF
jgi:hypothetical protein